MAENLDPQRQKTANPRVLDRPKWLPGKIPLDDAFDFRCGTPGRLA
ncbi:MAG TPA: hypothetical protein VFJ87_09385 [Rhodanobacteraceae bacterium]|nr:hypothetical protein [Rhodanobacteraceae bacterium]